MNDPQHITDRYITTSIFLWMLCLLLTFFVINESVLVPQNLGVALFCCIALILCLSFLADVFIRFRKSIPAYEDIIELAGKEGLESIKFRLTGASDFSERSSIFSKFIGVPKNHAQYRETNHFFFLSRVIHEIGHSRYKDCATVQTYIFICSTALLATLFIAWDILNAEKVGIEKFEQADQTYIITGFVFPFIVVVAISRLLFLLKFREYRADAYAINTIGERYIQFLEHQKLKYSFSKPRSFLMHVWDGFTHPSFGKRIKYLSRSPSQMLLPVSEGIQWTFIFCFSAILFFGGILIGSGGTFLVTTDGSFTPFQQHAAHVLFLISAVGLHCYLYGISKVQYAYLNNRNLKGSVAFTLASMASLIAVICMISSLYNAPSSKTEWTFSAIISLWFSLALASNMVLVRLRYENHMRLTRTAWSWITITLLIYFVAPFLPKAFGWISVEEMLLLCVSVLTAALVGDYFTGQGAILQTVKPL